VVFNPASGLGGDAAAGYRRQAIRAVLAAHGIQALWYETSRVEDGRSAAQSATREGVDLLLVSGGDGTVMACASALAATSVPVGIIPGGTGNIIAASLRVPSGVAAATEAALHGERMAVDVGFSAQGRPFFAAGIGFSAAVMRDATPVLKARAGMLAYAISAVRHARDRSATFLIYLDDEPPIVRKAHGVLVGNFSQLMTRPRLPKTSLDDGLLDVGILRIRPVLDWVRQRSPVFGPLTPPLDWHQAKRILVLCDRPCPVERDGDWVGEEARLEAQVQPRSLVVCVPGSVVSPVPARPVLRWVLHDAGALLSGRLELFRSRPS
jgi:diacylglycerol kinase family enzyme